MVGAPGTSSKSLPALSAPAWATSTLSTSTLSSQLRDADRRIQELHRLHATALFRFLLRWTYGERQTAEDLLQETLVRAWKNLDYLNPDLTMVRPWLYTVARRIAVDATRARRARPAEVGIDNLSAVPDGANDIDRMLDAHGLRLALSQLSVDHRQVLIEIYYRGRSLSEAAEVLGVPEGTVKSRCHHALRGLRKAFETVQAPP